MIERLDEVYLVCLDFGNGLVIVMAYTGRTAHFENIPSCDLMRNSHTGESTVYVGIDTGDKSPGTVKFTTSSDNVSYNPRSQEYTVSIPYWDELSVSPANNTTLDIQGKDAIVASDQLFDSETGVPRYSYSMTAGELSERHKSYEDIMAHDASSKSDKVWGFALHGSATDLNAFEQFARSYAAVEGTSVYVDNSSSLNVIGDKGEVRYYTLGDNKHPEDYLEAFAETYDGATADIHAMRYLDHGDMYDVKFDRLAQGSFEPEVGSIELASPENSREFIDIARVVEHFAHDGDLSSDVCYEVGRVTTTTPDGHVERAMGSFEHALAHIPSGNLQIGAQSPFDDTRYENRVLGQPSFQHVDLPFGEVKWHGGSEGIAVEGGNSGLSEARAELARRVAESQEQQASHSAEMHSGNTFNSSIVSAVKNAAKVGREVIVKARDESRQEMNTSSNPVFDFSDIGAEPVSKQTKFEVEAKAPSAAVTLVVPDGGFSAEGSVSEQESLGIR